MATDPTGGEQQRHRDAHEVAGMWRSGYPFALTPAGQASVRLFFEPPVGRVALRAPLRGPAPDVARWRNLQVSAKLVDGAEFHELEIRVEPGEIQAAYALATDVSDGIQLRGQSLDVALQDAVGSYERLLGRVAGLPLAREIGLFGELWLLNRLLADSPTHIGAWVGPMAEEHDFVFPFAAVECKSTSGERRSHVINGLGQLESTDDCPLFLLSFQFTRASGERGQSLPSAVGRARSLAAGRAADLETLLDAAGWRDEDALLYRSRWVLRSEPRFFEVDDSFPRLTVADLSGSPHLQRISEINYRIDLTGLEPATGPSELMQLLDPKGTS